MSKKIFNYIFLSILLVFIGVFFLFKYLRFNKNDLNKVDEADSLTIRLLDSIECECSKMKARKNLELGNVIAYYKSQNPYFGELAFIDYKIYVQPIINNVERKCAIEVMDSVIFDRYGEGFFENLEKKADSINTIRPWKGLSLDGFYLYADKDVKYKCGDLNKIIVDTLKEKGFLPLTQNECIPGELIIDFVVTEKGEITNIRILKRLDSKLDNEVINLLKNLPCSWDPAEMDGEKISHRKRMYFFFGKQPNPAKGIE